VREPHGFKAHLWVLGIEARAVGEGVSTASGGLRARSTAAGWLRWCSGEGKMAWELREVEAVLMVGDVGVERVWVGGSAVGWSSPGFKRGGGGVLQRGSEERAKERVKSNPGVLVVLRRAKDRELGLWFGLSTAASRWRPPGWFWKRRGCVARPRSSSARQQEGEEVVRDAWVPARGELMAGMAGKASAAALSVASAARTEQGGGRW